MRSGCAIKLVAALMFVFTKFCLACSRDPEHDLGRMGRIWQGSKSCSYWSQTEDQTRCCLVSDYRMGQRLVSSQVRYTAGDSTRLTILLKGVRLIDAYGCPKKDPTAQWNDHYQVSLTSLLLHH